MSQQDERDQAIRLFAGPGEMRSLMRSLDWSATPVGSIDRWPQSLKATIRIILASQYPMVLTWGPKFTQFYNDAYAKLIGSGHPAALGNDIRITLAEGWTTLGPMVATVMETGIANWTPALPLLMERSGYREEAYFSVSHAPAENDDGVIVGMLGVCSEVTSQVIGERRLKLLRELSARAAQVHELTAATAALAEVLSEHPLDIPFAALLLEDGEGLRLAAQTRCPQPILDGLPLQAAFDNNEKMLVTLSGTDRLAGGPWADPVRQVLALPLQASRQTAIGLLVVGISPARELDEAHHDFFSLLAQQASVALRNALAFEEERRRAEELAALDKAKTDFFSNVSHEFRTPLTLMLGPLEEALAAAPSSLPEHRGALQVAHRNALRLLRLVNTLLEFSRVEAQRADALLEPTDLSLLTGELVSNFRSAAERAGIGLELDIPPLPHPVRVDRDMWEKIVLNLVSNALKHTRKGAIKVSLHASANDIGLVVEDSGSGIAERDLPRIFERFHRVDNRQARSIEGSGIGLALVRQLVGLLGGVIDAESEIGVGSRFTVRLPATLYEPAADVSGSVADERLLRAYAEEAARWDDDLSVTRSEGGKLPKVLLADDNADMRNYIARLLARFCEVSAVSDGEAALEALQATRFDLVLTDVMMPKLDGFGVVARMRQDARMATIPIIMLSARAGEEARIEGIEAGADDYLVKPFSAKELVARIRVNLDLSRLRRELADSEARVARLEAIGQLTGGVAHDFNNLLTAISGSLELLSRRVADRPDLSRFVSIARTGAARGAKLTSQLLAFARRQPLSPKVIDVNVQLQEFLPLLRGAVGDAVDLVFRPAETGQSCRVDTSQLEVAILNLVLNARDASPAGSRVTIDISERHDGDRSVTCITVTDHGLGMSEETRERAIEPFFTTKDVGAGTGLGLSQVYGFAQQSGGYLRIDSEIGVGTAVTVFLPRTRTEAATHEAQGEQRQERNGRFVLVVEDEEPVRTVAMEVLREAGYRVLDAANGPEALAILQSDRHIDLVLTDVSMPKGMSGIDLAHETTRIRAGLPILLTSGYAEALRRDDHGFPLLPKPYSPDDLVRRVQSLLEGG